MPELLAWMSSVLFQYTLAAVSNRSSVTRIQRDEVGVVAVASIVYGLGSNPELVT
jgi:hypothetical protein